MIRGELFPAKNRVQQLCLWSGFTSKELLSGQRMTESFLDSVSCCKYTDANNCVVRGVLAKNGLLLKK